MTRQDGVLTGGVIGSQAGGAPCQDRCPRCGAGFACGMNGAGPCPCTTVTLAPELQAALRQRYSGCLCLACLRDLAAGAAIDPPSATA